MALPRNGLSGVENTADTLACRNNMALSRAAGQGHYAGQVWEIIGQSMFEIIKVYSELYN